MNQAPHHLDVVADNDNEDPTQLPGFFEPGFSLDLQDRFDFSLEPAALARPVGGSA